MTDIDPFQQHQENIRLLKQRFEEESDAIIARSFAKLDEEVERQKQQAVEDYDRMLRWYIGGLMVVIAIVFLMIGFQLGGMQ